MTQHAVTVIGGGVAGCAAALTAARLGASVTLLEQRGEHPSPLHQTDLLCELVGRPDLGATDCTRAQGLMKVELRVLVPDLFACADAVATGREMLTIDRLALARAVTERIVADPAVALVREEVRELPPGVVVVASGPITWSPLARRLHEAAGVSFRFAYAGRGPMVAAAGIDRSALFEAEPYPGADPAWYVRLSEDEAEELRTRLLCGRQADPPGLGPETVLAEESEPAERIAEAPRQFMTRLLAGPRSPGTEADRPALRLTPDDGEASRFHLADLITALTPDAQRNALAAVGALIEAKIVRPGVVHRLPWLPGPEAIFHAAAPTHAAATAGGNADGRDRTVEALATGPWRASTPRGWPGRGAVTAPVETLTGALCQALIAPPFNDGRLLQASFGLLPNRPEDQGRPKSERRAEQIERALAAAEVFATETCASRT